jgi:hypothetical protein
MPVTRADELDARPADTAKELLALADDLSDYIKRYSGDWSAASPTISWDELHAVVSALRLSARQQASVEEVARMLCNADGHDPDNVETFGIRTIRHGRRTDTGHDDRHGHREDCTSWPLWRGYEPIARALLAKYDIFEKVER